MDTKTKILDVAEKHFALFGFEGTSLRGIIKDAKVNVAAIAYHFGSKEDLYIAVIERFAAPVVEEQLSRLAQHVRSDELQISEILNAFYEPPIKLIKEMGERGETLSMFLGRCQTEPEPIFSLVDKNFAYCRDQFINAFRRLLPNIAEADYHWGFEFMLSLIVCFLTRQRPIRARYEVESDWDAGEIIDRLTKFGKAGLLSLQE